jgi:hypothetical protein
MLNLTDNFQDMDMDLNINTLHCHWHWQLTQALIWIKLNGHQPRLRLIKMKEKKRSSVNQYEKTKRCADIQ